MFIGADKRIAAPGETNKRVRQDCCTSLKLINTCLNKCLKDKSKSMPFVKKYLTRTKTEIKCNFLEQGVQFNLFGCKVSPIVDCDVENKFNKFKDIIGGNS